MKIKSKGEYLKEDRQNQKIDMASKIQQRSSSSILINNHIHRISSLKPPHPIDKRPLGSQSKNLCLISASIKPSIHPIIQQSSSSSNLNQNFKEHDIYQTNHLGCIPQQSQLQGQPTNNVISDDHFPALKQHLNGIEINNSTQEQQRNIIITETNFKSKKFRISSTQVFFSKKASSDHQETLRAQSKLIATNNDQDFNQPTVKLPVPLQASNRDVFNRQTNRIRSINFPSRCPSPKQTVDPAQQATNVIEEQKVQKPFEEIRQIKDESQKLNKKPSSYFKKPPLRRPSFDTIEPTANANAASKGCSSNHFSIQSLARKNSYWHMQFCKKKEEVHSTSRVSVHHNQNLSLASNKQSDSINCISKSERNCVGGKVNGEEEINKECRNQINNKENIDIINPLNYSNCKEGNDNSTTHNNKDGSILQNDAQLNFSPSSKQQQPKKRLLSKQQAQLNAHLFAISKPPPLPALNLQHVNQVNPFHAASIFLIKALRKQGIHDQSNGVINTFNPQQQLKAHQPRNFQDVELRELLGEGAHGKVFKGFLKKTGKFIAVKQLKIQQPHQSSSKDNIAIVQQQDKYQQYLKEIIFLNHLEHPHIVKYYGFKVDGDYLYIYMEQMTGGSISLMLRQFGKFDEALIKKFVKQIMQGLVYLHSKNFVHRDIKGANILSDGNGTVKLADFGAARFRDTLCLPSTSESEFCNSIKGSLYWMAPELLNQESHGRKSDVWSLGCTVIEMATGKHPWPECKTFPELVATVKSLQCPPIPDHLSEECQNFIRQCCTFDKKARLSAEVLLHHSFLQE